MKRIKFSSSVGGYVSDDSADIEHGTIEDITIARYYLEKGVPDVSHAMTVTDEMYEILSDEYYFTDEKPNELPDNILADYIRIAEAERAAGAKVEINRAFQYVSIYLSDGMAFYFQGYEADEILSGIPDNISAEDYLLAQAVGW